MYNRREMCSLSSAIWRNALVSTEHPYGQALPVRPCSVGIAASPRALVSVLVPFKVEVCRRSPYLYTAYSLREGEAKGISPRQLSTRVPTKAAC